MKQFDVTVCLQSYPGIQWSIEVDAAGEEEACDNRNFICSRCLSTAYALFGLMEKYAREEDTADIRDKWKEITGADIKEWG